jgi:ADP-ribosylglycohydrolase
MSDDKLIRADYRNLEPMVEFIKAWWREPTLSDLEKARAEHALRDFCFRYPQKFKTAFFTAVGMPRPRRRALTAIEDVRASFLKSLLGQPSDKIFILRDTHELLTEFLNSGGQGAALLVNRKNLFAGESQYFEFLRIFYEAASRSTDLEGFLDQYQALFACAIASHENLHSKAKDIAKYVALHRRNSHVTFVDLGFQFTFSLFCRASLIHFGEKAVNVDFYALATYPWLHRRFGRKVFTDRNEVVLPLELAGRTAFDRALSKRAAGALVGFAIGDALGYPVAGVEARDIAQRLGIALPLTHFVSSPNHPHFGHLKPGQYTSNTIAMLITARSLADDRSVDPDAIAERLCKWRETILLHPEEARWLGPTTATALDRLIAGVSTDMAGVADSSSCACAYRSVPLGIFLRPMIRTSLDEARERVAKVARITHAHPASIAGAQVVASIIGDLIHGVMPRDAVRAAIAAISDEQPTRLLKERLRETITLDDDDEGARHRFGTGSPIEQTLPLSIYFLLRYSSDFANGVRAAANSVRRDSPTDAAALADYEFGQSLVQAKAGNCDGVAGLTGAMIGTHLGIDAIPPDLAAVEGFAELSSAACSLL